MMPRPSHVPLWHGSGDAPAKINLGLQILRRTPDGYHDIRTVMVGLDLADSLEIEAEWGHARPAEARPALELHMEGLVHGVVADETNLVLKAARLFLARSLHRLATGARAGAGLLGREETLPVYPDVLRFRLHKRVPAEGGLGGGSSDAAATLRLLNALPGAAFDDAALLDMAAALGSDIPYALVGGCRLAEGRGERLTPLPPAPPWHVVLVRPDLRVPTPWCYRRWDELNGGGTSVDPGPLREKTARMDALLLALRQRDLEGIGRLMFNDLQDPVLREWPALEALPALLRDAGCAAAAMTGSGSCFFGLAATADDAERAAARVSEQGLGQVWLTRLRTEPGPSEEA